MEAARPEEGEPPAGPFALRVRTITGGTTTLRDVVSSIDELEQETQGSRLWVFPKHRRDEPEHLRSPPPDRDDRRRHERGARGSSRGERGGAPPPPKRPRAGKSGGPPPPPRRGSPKRR